ncbi:antibiotic biosynthesis monooxygenase family protein [Sphaerisporangium corydalis]|uniref:Antibiotic biosynthesis monooxygenase family protein n=1 Tax=Sphaerisporangium corydalis TaxID=1441875 RepID=A0ABV9EEZ8_9ACTN|nr:antibiotic biosynthesis monooxygenase [Sphaerisporangium corydalis]
MSVLVFVHYRGPERPLRSGYAQTAGQLAATPGLLGVELLRGVGGEDRWVLLMRWSGMDAYQSWEGELRRLGHPSPLRPFQDRSRPGGHYEIFTEN